MITEAEAKTKWCPLKRTADHVHDQTADASYPSPAVAHNDGAKCIGSACMAWRWAPVADYAAAKVRTSKTHGYCGAFDRPHQEGPE